MLTSKVAHIIDGEKDVGHEGNSDNFGFDKAK